MILDWGREQQLLGLNPIIRTWRTNSFSSPAVRGSGIQTASATSYTVSWPSGSAAGDLAIIFAEQTNVFTVPTGWSAVDSVYNVTGTISGIVIWKVLTAADITATSVALALSGSASPGTVAIITFIGALELSCRSAQSTSGVSSVTFTVGKVPYSVATTALYFCSDRANSANTVNLGSSLQTSSATSTSAALYSDTTLSGSGALNPTFSFGTTGGYYVAAVLVFSGSEFSYSGGNALPAFSRIAQGLGSIVTGTVPTQMGGPQKNTAYAGFSFTMYDSAGLPKTGLSVNATRRLDGGAFAACAGSVTEVSSGWYSIDLAASDLNANTVAFRFYASGAQDTSFAIYPAR